MLYNTVINQTQIIRFQTFWWNIMLLNEVNPFARSASHMFYINNAKHTKTYDSRLYYILNDGGYLHIDNKKIRLIKSMIIYFMPNTLYRYESYDYDPIELITINFDMTQAHNYIEPMSPIFADEFDECKITEYSEIEYFRNIIILDSMKHLENDFKMICNEFKQKQFAYREKSSGILKSILISIMRENYININNIGDEFHYHPYYLNRLFKKANNMTIHQYIIYYRINLAKSLLEQSNYTINEIAFRTGFLNQSYFTQIFTRITETTPSKYRKLHKKYMI